MEGSSDTGWQKADSERNLRLLHSSRLSLSTDTSRNSRNSALFGPELSDLVRNQLDSSGVSEFYQLEIDPSLHNVEWGDVSMRHWLDNSQRTVDVIESLHIFRQIVEIVNSAHSQGIVLNNVRPSCFVMSSFNHVSFIESASSDSGSDSLEDGRNVDIKLNRETSYEMTDSGSSEKGGAEKKQPFPMKEVLIMETSWYTTPEEIAGAPCSCASDIYRLGVLLFELICKFSSTEDKSRTMSSLWHRVLPPQLLLKWPKQASFCLWLLHPDPSSRPKTGELLQSEFLNERRDDIDEREAAIKIREKLEEHELLLEFLLLMRQSKQDAANKLQDTLSFLSTDIDEIESKPRALNNKGHHFFDMDTTHQTDDAMKCEFDHSGINCSEMISDREKLLSNNSRLLKNFKKLEAAYLLTRQRSERLSRSKKSIRGNSHLSSNSRGSVENMSIQKENEGSNRGSGWINPFLDGLCKYLSFTRLTVKANLKQGDLLSSSNLVCSVSFDRDGEFFATAGVNKRIKIFECDGILNGDRDIHYPLVEMASQSKLSSICWNSYIKSQIASSNFEGVVQVWDTTRSQVFMELKEHKRRVWSVEFSSADPTLLASGSDDGSVKLWSINQGGSINTIKTKANVCCVQFPTDSGRSLAFGSADHRIYYYDLRNTRIPLWTMVGHNKTVSYVKFVDSTSFVSSSTDNTLKLWDLSSCTSGVVQDPVQSYTGHTNVKNFVGLSVSDGYIATGSETNEVFIYHKAFPMPALSYKFNTVDPHSSNETDDSAQFISSVCWRGQSNMVVAANSTGEIKLLKMV